jgi:uncharacterized repeat protein (TIGR02543 family)
MKFVSLVPSYLRVPGPGLGRLGFLRLPLTMLALASLALSSLLFLAPIPVQAAPVANDDSATVDHNSGPTQIDVLNNDTPDPGEPVIITEVTQGINGGSVAITSGGLFLTYQPPAVYTGTDSFDYTITDTTLETATATVTITVDAIPHELTVRSSSGGSVTEPDEAGSPYTYQSGTRVDLVATPNTGREFEDWTGSGVTAGAVDNPLEASTFITMNDDYTVRANFGDMQEYTLTIEVTGSGSATPAVGPPYYENDVVSITATPADGWTFANWEGADDNGANPTTVTMDANKTVTANFTEIPTYTLRMVTSGSGSTDPAAGPPHTYREGETVTIEAFPGPGYVFFRWDGDVASTSANPTTVTMDSNKTVTAYFTSDTRVLSIASTEGGSTIPSEGEYERAAGAILAIQAIPAEGWSFVNWTGDVEDVGDVNAASTTITMNGDYSITANFGRTRTLTIAIVGNGSTDPEEGEHEYADGATVPITATPESGWQFDGWSGDLTGSANPGTITITGATSVTANFSQITGPTYTLTVAIEGEGTTTPPAGENVFAQGEDIPILATPAEGWMFNGWTGDVDYIADTGAMSTTITMNGDYSITANFVEGALAAVDQEVTTPEDTPVEITLTASNPGGAGLTFSIVDIPAHGQLSGEVPNLTYTPEEGYTGSDSFTFTVNDGTNDSNTATVTITVEAAGTGAESDSDGMSVPPWVWVLLAGGSIIAGAIALFVMERRSATE